MLLKILESKNSNDKTDSINFPSYFSIAGYEPVSSRPRIEKVLMDTGDTSPFHVLLDLANYQAKIALFDEIIDVRTLGELPKKSIIIETRDSKNEDCMREFVVYQEDNVLMCGTETNPKEFDVSYFKQEGHSAKALYYGLLSNSIKYSTEELLRDENSGKVHPYLSVENALEILKHSDSSLYLLSITQ